MRKPITKKPLAQRFWEKVDKGNGRGCWLWTGIPASTGYGQLSRGGRGNGTVHAHRVSWELHNGPIPPRGGAHGAVVMHICDNRLCVNPKHLMLGSQSDNVADMDAKSRRRNRNLRGVQHGMSKWTEAQVRAVKRATGSYREIAEQTGVALGSVKQIKLGKVWRHIT